MTENELIKLSEQLDELNKELESLCGALNIICERRDNDRSYLIFHIVFIVIYIILTFVFK